MECEWLQFSERLIPRILTPRRFRWVQCQIEELSRLRTDKAIRNALTSVPRDLHETYEKMTSKITIEDAETARRALIWLSTAQRPLTIDELAQAVIIELDDT
jgi:hypothetical protein